MLGYNQIFLFIFIIASSHDGATRHLTMLSDPTVASEGLDLFGKEEIEVASNPSVIVPPSIDEAKVKEDVKDGNSHLMNTSVYVSNDILFRPVFSSIENGEKHTYPYHFNASTLEMWPAIQIQLYAETEKIPNNSSEEDLFLLVTVEWLGSVRSWEIPVNYVTHDDKGLGQRNTRFSDLVVGKTLWNYPMKIFEKKMWDLTVDLVLAHDALVYYKLRIVVIDNFNIPITGSTAGQASPTSPAFFQLDNPPPNWDYVLVRATSESNVCTLMSVQQPRGPFLETEKKYGEVQFSESFTRVTGLTVRASDFPNGFLVVFTPLTSDLRCQRSFKHGIEKFVENKDSNRIKNFSFEIQEGITPFKNWTPIFLPLLVFLGLCIPVLVMLFAFQNIKRRTLKRTEKKPEIIERSMGTFSSNIMIEGLIVTDPNRVVDQSRRYCRAGFIMFSFYAVPVFQLILTFSQELIETGDLDICYFNQFCSHMFGQFYDFNHIYSNIWYILFGLFYILVVWIRQIMTPRKVNQSSRDEEREVPETNSEQIVRTRNLDKGVMIHYGLLYCMGYALMMTGVMSAAYHICPNQNNFQFDTVFMYTFAAITVVTIYQSRHPTYLSANFTFTALALVVFISVLGLLWDKLILRIVFTILHFLFLVISLPKVCYNGYVRRNNRIVPHWHSVMKIIVMKWKDDWKTGSLFQIQRSEWHAPDNPEIMILPGPGRIILPGFLFIINVGAVLLMWTLLLEQNFPTQVLFVCVTNGSLYSIFYSLLKLYHGECRRVLWLQAAIYSVASLCLWAAAVYFFLDEVSAWEDSPAESRMKNRDCTLLSYYDPHDVWHFLSASALFCSAMVLLTVDDDLVDQPKSTIPVF